MLQDIRFKTHFNTFFLQNDHKTITGKSRVQKNFKNLV